jgi:hypothetical protein
MAFGQIDGAERQGFAKSEDAPPGDKSLRQKGARMRRRALLGRRLASLLEIASPGRRCWRGSLVMRNC